MNTNNKISQLNYPARGFSMIEVLITVVILAVGLLGLAGLQITGLSSGQNAYLRTVATQQAYDVADRMRANPAGVQAGNYNSISGNGTNPNCISSGCTVAQMAQYDAWEWQSNNALYLPSGAGAVCIDSTPNDGTPAAPACDGAGNLYAIKVWWDSTHSGSANTLFATSFRP